MANLSSNKSITLTLSAATLCLLVWGCNITPTQTECGGPTPRCQCATSTLAQCTAGQWVCVCNAVDMIEMPDLSSDLSSDASVDMVDMPSEMSYPSCAELDKTSLPQRWTALDIETYEPSRVGYNGREFCVDVASADVWGAADAFHYLYQEVEGDVDIRARVVGFTGVNPYTKIGVMIRKDASRESPMVAALTTTNQGEQFTFRPRRALSAVSLDDATMRTEPTWVRVVRRGDWVVGLSSADGQSWKRLGQTRMPSFDARVLVGLAASSHSTQKTFATFDQVDISKPAQNACPGALDCPDVFSGADEARVGGLLVSLFDNASRFDVTNINDFGQGSLRWALEQAQSQPGYSVIEVAPSLKGQTIMIQSNLPAAERTWLRGNGVIVSGSTEEPPSYNECAQTMGCQQRPRAFTLKSLTVLEGFTIKHVQFGVFSRDEGTGIWVHHNTFEYCSNVYADFTGNKGGQRRYLTLSDNRFVGSTSSGRANAILFQTCSPSSEGCDADPTNVFVSMHHNYFDAAMTHWFPSGGVKLLSYNNFFDGVANPAGLGELWGSGQVLSVTNVVRAITTTVMYRDGIVESRGDTLNGPASLGGTLGMVRFTPSYAYPAFDKASAVESYTTEQSGSPR